VSGDDPGDPGEAGGRERAGFYDRVIAPFVHDPGLWPVTAILVGHVAVFLAPLLLWVHRSDERSADVALAVAVAVTLAVLAYDRRRRGGVAEAGWLLLAGWAAGFGLAWLADRYGVF